MEVIERFLLGKRPDQTLCEDMIVETPDFIGVLDGVTSKNDMLWPDGEKQVSGGVKATLLLKDVIENLDNNASVEDFLKKVNAKFTSCYKEAGLYEHLKKRVNHKERCQACLALYSSNRKEVWVFGDCQVKIDGKQFVKESGLENAEMVYSKARALYLECELEEGKTIDQLLKKDTGREFIMPLIKKYSQFSNDGKSPLGYCVIDGFDIPLNLIDIIDSKEAKEIIMTSDGYPEVSNSLKEAEEVLKTQLKIDPLCFRENPRPKALNKGYNSFDDRCYIRFNV